MKFRGLQEQLRKNVWKRIDKGEITGMRLADLAGFRQAHMSNFLNRKRGLSLSAMDSVLGVLELSVLDLLDPGEVSKRATIPAPSEDEYENVLLVEPEVAANEELFIQDKVKDVLKFKKSFVRRLRPELAGKRAEWHRFALIKVDARDGMSMYPRLLPGATLLIDRHYNSLKPYRQKERNMYAVLKDGTCTVKYVEAAEGALILRPHNDTYPVTIVNLEEGKSAEDYLIGRVCHVAIET